MKNLKNYLISGMIGFGSLVLGNEGYGQKIRIGIDTIYNNNKEIDKIVFRGENSFSILNYASGKKVSEDYFGYEKDKLIFYRRTEIDRYGRTIVKEDFNGDGTINWMFIENKEKDITLIDENNDGIFDYERRKSKKEKE